jgi:outer membrane protein
MTQYRIVLAFAAAMLAAAASPAAAQTAAAQQAAATPNSYKIGYVDTERVMRDSRASKQVKKELDDEYLRRAKEVLAGPPGDVERRKAALADEMNMKREFAQKQFVDKANDTLRRIAEAEKFDAVFLEAAYASTRIDLTDRIIKSLDAAR